MPKRQIEHRTVKVRIEVDWVPEQSVERQVRVSEGDFQLETLGGFLERVAADLEQDGFLALRHLVDRPTGITPRVLSFSCAP